MMKADWDMTPVKGGSGNAFFGKSDEERVFIKKNGSPFLPSIYLEGITPKVLWTKRTAEGDTLSAQPWIDGHTLSPEDMEDHVGGHCCKGAFHVNSGVGAYHARRTVD